MPDTSGDTLSGSFWDSRPILQHIHNFARARCVAPTAMLGSVLARAVACTPPGYVLPAFIGGYGSLNLFINLVGPSGGGKGAADAAGQHSVRMVTGKVGELDDWVDPIEHGALYTADVGSGEGLLHAYTVYDKDEGARQVRACAMLTVPEVDHLGAVSSRQGATVMPMLRKGWSGEALNPQYADRAKRLRVAQHSYRLALVLGVQPGRAGVILDDSDGGTPQRFVWLPTADPEAPDMPPVEPEPMEIRIALPPSGLYAVPVCEEAKQEILAARRAQLRGVALAHEMDGHRLLAQEKVAAGLAILDGHLVTEGITLEDWQLARMVMTVSDATRRSVEEHRRNEVAEVNRAKGEAEATREQIKHDRLESTITGRVENAVLRYVERKPDEWFTEASIRRRLDSRYRVALTRAIANLEASNKIQVESIVYNNQPGLRLRMAS